MPPLIAPENSYLNKLDYPNRSERYRELIDALLVSASQALENYLGRKLAATNFVETHDGDGQELIIVRNPPIISLTSITFLGSTDVVNDGADFIYDSNVGEIRWDRASLVSSTSDNYGWFPSGFRNIEIAYRGGFATIPEELQDLIAQAVIQRFDRREAAGQIEKLKMGNLFIDHGNELKDFILTNKRMLSKYKLWHV